MGATLTHMRQQTPSSMPDSNKYALTLAQLISLVEQKLKIGFRYGLHNTTLDMKGYMQVVAG